MFSKRSRLYVDKETQGRLLWRMATYATLYHIAFWHVVFMYYLLGDTVFAGTVGERAKRIQVLYVQFFHDNAWLMSAFLAMVPILVFDMLRFTNRIFGPLHRCRVLIQQMVDGKPVSQIHLRKGDLMTKYVGVINQLVQRCNDRLGEVDSPAEDEQKPVHAELSP